MGKFTFEGQPRLRLLSDEQIETIHDRALYLLEHTGVRFQSPQALRILQDCGARVDFDTGMARFNPEMVLDALRAVPGSLQLFDRNGEPAVLLGGGEVNFDPGSAATELLESDGTTVRQAEAEDLVDIARVTDALANIAVQSTSVALSDVPNSIGDSYRLYLLLKNSAKPVVTGAFSVHGIGHMRDMLAAVVGGRGALRDKPVAVFDICPSPALKWTEISSRNIIDCARSGLPIQFVSMPMPGAATPVTLSGSVLVHTVETLSGVVLAQSVNPGTPAVYGGAPVQFDMRSGITPLSAVEATMMAAAYGQLGKYYGMPTHTYACLSDSRVVDAQAGLETAMSGILAQLAGIDLISGPGLLDCAGCFSLEKLVIDDQVCGMARRLHRGLDCSQEALAVDLIDELGPGGDYLSTEHTLEWFRKEQYIPSRVIDRRERNRWEQEGSRDAFARAQKKVRELVGEHRPAQLDEEREEMLDEAARGVMAELDITCLPLGPERE